MQIIDVETWARKAHFEHFRRFDCPRWDLCTELDVTPLRDWCKQQNVSFYHAMVHCVTEAVQAVEAFLYRLRGEQVVLHELVHPRFTDMDKGSELFKLVTTEFVGDRIRFIELAQQKARAQTEPFPEESRESRDDLVYLTCVPWLSFTRISHAWNLSKDDTVPRFAWGKFSEKNGRLVLPFAIEANHVFVDGIHMAHLLETLQARLAVQA